MLHKNILSSSSTISTVLWTIFVISLSALLHLGCWYCNTLCRSHARLRQICHCNKEPEAGTPLHPLYSNSPPALDIKDEISYLARSMAVLKSLWSILTVLK